jgi:transcriptional regulator with XRE-family HTH domain
MTNTMELEILIKRAGLTKREVAEKLDISSMGLYKKMNNHTEFKGSEIDVLMRLLSIDDMMTMRKIFFIKKSDEKSTKSISKDHEPLEEGEFSE